MHPVEFVGGSLDGTTMKVSNLRSHFRMPSLEGKAWSEVYERQADGRYHFSRHGVPPLMPLPADAEVLANAKLAEIVEALMPHLYRLDEHFRQRGGWTDLVLGPWQVVRRDDVPVQAG